MPTAADYASTANSVYDPQAQSEETQAGSARDATLASLDTQERSIDPYYTKAEDTLKTAKNDALAKNDFEATNALDGNSSGLKTNADARTNSDYFKNLEGLTSEQAGKHADIASARALANKGYEDTVSSIIQKYSGMKAGYVADQLKADADRAFQERMAQQANAAQLAAAKAYAGGSGSSGPTPEESLNTDIYNSLSNFLVRPKGYSENVILPALYKQYGGQLKTDDIKNAFYNARKSLGYG